MRKKVDQTNANTIKAKNGEPMEIVWVHVEEKEILNHRKPLKLFGGLDWKDRAFGWEGGKNNDFKRIKMLDVRS